MKKELANLIDRIKEFERCGAEIIGWGCPIISFGDIRSAKVATIGLNPSNREFVDKKGEELEGNMRRFHTLRSLGLKTWSDATDDHFTLILEFCFHYFHRNPYDSWFRKLDFLISGTNTSFYFPSSKACHLDLVPFATFCKWTDLKGEKKDMLLRLAGDFLGALLNRSCIEVIVLNGRTVVENMKKVSRSDFQEIYMKEWTLPRKSGGVKGIAYTGTIDCIGRIKLKRAIKVLGYNHNIQSSYGVTKAVHTAIRNWISESIKQQ